jgi:hypothetical protein
VFDVKPWEVSELDGLPSQGKRTGDEGLRGDDGRTGCNEDRGIESPLRDHPVEGVLDGTRLEYEKSSLSEVVEEESGEDDAKPGESDRDPSKVSHISVE